MRTFVMTDGTIVTEAADYLAVPEGKLALFRIDPETKKPAATNFSMIVNAAGEFNIVVGRPAEKGGPIIVPFYHKNVTAAFQQYEARSVGQATIEFPVTVNKGTYSIIFVKKGKLFNERSNYTVSIYVNSDNTLSTTIRDKFITEINRIKDTLGLTDVSSNSGSVRDSSAIDLDLADDADLLEIIPADGLMGTKVTQFEVSSLGQGSYADIVDLAEKCAADSGFNYTYDETVTLYPNYPLPVQTVGETGGYDVLTIGFTEPRKVKTTDTYVRQLIHIAAPKGAAGLKTIAEALGLVTSMMPLNVEDVPAEEFEEKAIDPKDLVED